MPKWPTSREVTKAGQVACANQGTKFPLDSQRNSKFFAVVRNWPSADPVAREPTSANALLGAEVVHRKRTKLAIGAAINQP